MNRAADWSLSSCTGFLQQRQFFQSTNLERKPRVSTLKRARVNVRPKRPTPIVALKLKTKSIFQRGSAISRRGSDTALNTRAPLPLPPRLRVPSEATAHKRRSQFYCGISHYRLTLFRVRPQPKLSFVKKKYIKPFPIFVNGCLT